MARLSKKNVQASPTRELIPEPCANCYNPDASGPRVSVNFGYPLPDNCFNPDASGPVCTACRYPRFILDSANKHPGIGCTRCLFLDFERLDNKHCNACRSTGQVSCLRMWKNAHNHDTSR